MPKIDEYKLSDLLIRFKNNKVCIVIRHNGLSEEVSKLNFGILNMSICMT